MQRECEETMTTALENAMALEREKFAADNQNLTPMEQGYYDALAKLGYAQGGAQAAPQRGGYAARIKAAAEPPQMPPMAGGLKHPTQTQGGMARPAPKKSGPLRGAPRTAPAAPALGGRTSTVPGIRGGATRGQ